MLDERGDEFAEIMNKEMGKPVFEGKREVMFTTLGIRAVIKQAEDALKPTLVDMGFKKAMTVYQPLGVIYSILPWNFPLIIPLQSNIQSMLAGNTVLYKPAPNTPQTAQLLEKLFEDAGFGNGEFTLTYASTDDTDFIIGHHHIRGVNFTGSTAAGKMVAQICGKHMKKCQFELGGSDPFIVLDDADLDKAVMLAVIARLVNCGQACNSPKRIIVLNEVYNEFKENLIDSIAKTL